MRVEDAHPAIATKQEFRCIARMMQSRAAKKVNPRRISSRYLLSGLAECETCGKAMTTAEAKRGKHTYYICHSLLKRGKGTCKTPRLNAKKSAKLLDEEMDGVAHEQRDRLETIEGELEDVKKRLGRIWNFIETSDTEMADASDRIWWAYFDDRQNHF